MEHKTVSLADQVFERLETDILTGKYNRGDIVTESRFAEDLGVSRTPVREALRRLEQEHIIEESGRGIKILGVTENDLADIYEIRLLTEGLAAYRAALSDDCATFEELKEALDLQAYYVEKRDPDRIKYQDSLFHETLYRLSGSTALYDTLLPLHKKVQKFRKVAVQSQSRADASLAEHRAIFDAIANKDAEGAANAMTQHIENAKKHILGR